MKTLKNKFVLQIINNEQNRRTISTRNPTPLSMGRTLAANQRLFQLRSELTRKGSQLKNQQNHEAGHRLSGLSHN